jgi:DNA processing protein
MTPPEDLPSAAWAAALAGFEGMTLARLSALLRHHSPCDAFDVASGRRPPVTGTLVARVLDDAEVRSTWARSAATRPPEVVWQRCTELQLEVSVLGQPSHPAVLSGGRQPAPVLFTRGDRGLLDPAARRVSIVGTRNATAAGRSQAAALARDLGRAGVHVVSGLARGIDGAAHSAMVADRSSAGRPVAVVASGLDVVYPSEHRRLWAAVGNTGLLVSEHPPGSPPTAWRFPQRNRLVAQMAEVVVVVESRERGGSLITAELAIEQGTPVMAVPGHVASRASAGTNELLRDGAAPVLDASDVLLALRLAHRHVPSMPGFRQPVRSIDREVLARCRELPSTLGGLVESCGRSIAEVAGALSRLEDDGWLSGADGWYEATGSASRSEDER